MFRELLKLKLLEFVVDSSCYDYLHRPTFNGLEVLSLDFADVEYEPQYFIAQTKGLGAALAKLPKLECLTLHHWATPEMTATEASQFKDIRWTLPAVLVSFFATCQKHSHTP